MINISNLSLSSLFPLYIWKVFLSAYVAGSTMAMLTKGICLRNSNHQAGLTNVKQCLPQVGGSREGARGGDGRGAPKVGGIDQYFLFVAFFAYFAYVAYLQSKVGGLNEDVAQVGKEDQGAPVPERGRPEAPGKFNLTSAVSPPMMITYLSRRTCKSWWTSCR